MAQRLPANPVVQRMKGDLFLARRDPRGAEMYWDSLEASEHSVSENALRIRLCRISLMLGRMDDFRQRCGSWRPVARAFLELRVTGDTARATRILEPVLQRSTDSLAEGDGSYDHLVVTLAELGRVQEAWSFYERWRQQSPDNDWLGRAAGSIILAEGRPDSAVAAFMQWYADGPWYLPNRGLTEAAYGHELAGRPDSAVALYERALATPSIYGYGYESYWYPFVLRRLGELHESLGHRDAAVKYYSKFIDLWKDADPELQPQVEAAREALARLMEEPRE
jgi:tetratricopeptide (TPR) repeat protein